MDTKINTNVKYLAMVVLGLNNYYYFYSSFTQFFNKLKNVSFFLLLILLVLFAQSSSAQTTKTVGTGGNYTTLKLAFDAINAGTITGAITIQIISSTTETSSAILNASGTGTANYSSVNIYPTGSGYTISGNINSHMVDLNGADYVTIDGRVNASGSSKNLTIVNTNTGTSATTIRLINSAQNNTVKYCTIKGSETNQMRGIVFFSTSLDGNGNDNNLIDNNDITNNAGNRVINAILSSGTASRENSGNTISNNNIFDVWRTSTSSYNIQLGSYSTNWTISGNSFYETTSFVPSSSSTTYNPIRISNTSGIGFVITDNYIGGQTPLCGGSAFTVNAPTTHLFQAISINVGTSTPSSVQNNTIKNINYTGSSTSLWQGIYISAGSVNVGTITGNKIGASTGTGSVVVTGNVTGTVVQGINFAGSGAVNIHNNTIGSLTINNSNSTFSNNFYAINRTNTGTSFVVNNLIGSTETSNSIQVTSASTSSDQSVFGIRNTTGGSATFNNNTIANMSNATTNTTSGTLGLISGILSNYGITTITNNNIYNLTIANNNTASSSAASITGIAVASTNALNTISGNKIYNLSNTYTSFSGSVIGLYFGSTGMYTTISHTVTENFIHDLSVTGSSASTANIYGIKVNTGQTTYANNIISLGGNTANTIYGIYEYGTSANNNSLYFNTVYIGGSLNAGVTNKSYALFSSVSSNVRNIRNNIFTNARSTASGSNLHYAAYFNYSSYSSITLNYNDYYVSGTGGVLGYFNSTNKTSLPLVTGQDDNSLNINPNLSTAGGTLPENYYSSATLPGISGTLITTDYFGISRGSTPKMGAFETETYIYTWQGNTSSNFGTASNWVGGIVPPDGVDITFASSPANHCLLDQNRTIRNFTSSNASYKLNLNGKQLTIHGNLNVSNNAQIDASSSSSVVAFESSSTQNIPSGAFVSNTVGGLTVNNIIGLTLNNDLTVQQGLTLTNGTLSIGAYSLTLNGAVAATSGTLSGSSSANLILGGSGSAVLPGVILNNLTLNRSNGVTLLSDVSVLGTLTLSSGTLTIGTSNSLTVANNLTITSGNINASNDSASIIFNNSTALTLPAALFTGNIFNLHIVGTGGITAQSDLTINGVLFLSTANPSATKGLLDMGSFTLNMGANAVTTGSGDAEGIVKRTSFLDNVSYTFGNEFTNMTFVSGGTMPTEVYFKITIGESPSWKLDAVKRSYDIIHTGGDASKYSTISLHYLDGELNSNLESDLVIWDYHSTTPKVEEHGKASGSYTDKWISIDNRKITYFATAFNDHIWGLSKTLSPGFTWGGQASSDWNDVNNWPGGVVPSSTSNVIIPNAETTLYDPTLPDNASINRLLIQSGGILNGGVDTKLTIEGASQGNGAWVNEGGTFNPGSSNVTFTYSAASISGVNNFYNITINSGATLIMDLGSTMRVSGVMTNNGTWRTVLSGNSIVEYNGGNQLVVVPNASTNRYSTLILSGTGTKTMPVTSLSIYGNFIISGTTTVTAGSELSIGGNLSIGDSSTFNTGNFNHTINGNFENNGTFNAATGFSITLSSDTGRYISGASPISFKNLNVNNLDRIMVYANLSVVNSLVLTRGYLCLGGSNYLPNNKSNSKNLKTKGLKNNLGFGFLDETTMIISGDLTMSQNTKIEATSSTSTIEFAGSTPQTIPDAAFLDNMVNKIKINNPNGVTLNTDLIINGTLTLTNGILNTGTKSIVFSSLAVDPVEKSTSRILGTAIAQNIPAGIGSFSFLSCYISAGADDIGHVTVTRKTGPLGVVSVNGNNSIQSNWEITSDFIPSGGRSVEYRWLSDLDNGKSFSSINRAINCFSTDNGTTWSLFGDPVDVSPSNPRVMAFSTTHFSKWVSSDQNSPLPVTLSSLNSTVNGRNVKLNWTTASEINNKGFDVERKTLTGSWSKVGFIQGKGTVNTSSNYSFEDRFLTTGKYSYRLKQIDFNGNYEYHNMNGVVEIGVPTKYDLSQNYPNPFNPVTKINFELPYDAKVSLIIFDMTGREIKTLVNEVKTAGYYTQFFDGSGISSGTYFYRIIANANGKDYIATKKMILVK